MRIKTLTATSTNVNESFTASNGMVSQTKNIEQQIIPMARALDFVAIERNSSQSVSTFER